MPDSANLFSLQAIAAAFAAGLLFSFRRYHSTKNYLPIWTASWGSLAVAYAVAAVALNFTLPSFVAVAFAFGMALAGVIHGGALLAGCYELARLQPLRRSTAIRLFAFLVVVAAASTTFGAMTLPNYRLLYVNLLPTIAVTTAIASFVAAAFVGRWRARGRSSHAFIVLIFVLSLYGLYEVTSVTFIDLSRETIDTSMILGETAIRMFLAFVLVTALLDDEREAALLAAAEVEHLAYFDALTGLPNRAYLFDRLVAAVDHAGRYKQQIAVLFVDLDRFKPINDTLGHASGDLLLRTTAQRIRDALRDSDIVARFGGDEFVILVPQFRHFDDVMTVARKVADATRQPFTLGGRMLTVTSSIGVSLFPADATDAPSLVKNADVAMYRAKELGRDTIQLYSASMSEDALENLALENQLRSAIANGELVLYYQPLIDLVHNRPFGVEALLRWNHPQRGLLLPDQFIRTAEQTGTIISIGRWVLAEACRQVRAWLDDGIDLLVSVNLSARQFRQPDLVDDVRRVLLENRLDPQRLELEITETSAMEMAEETVNRLQSLKHLGVRIGIDDFGTGYSSLSYLKRFPIDTLKLDQSLVKDIGVPGEGAIATAVIAMAHSLGVKVIAEGVESEQQLQFLKDQLCDRVQGYHFTVPLPPDKLSAYLEQYRQLVAPDAFQPAPSARIPIRRAVLVVDDDPTIRHLVTRILERENYVVDTAKDGYEAIEILKEKSYAVIFLDLMMPRVDGLGVIRFLAGYAPERLANVVVMTAVSPVTLEGLAKQPVGRVLAKPFDITQVVVTARECAWLSDHMVS